MKTLKKTVSVILDVMILVTTLAAGYLILEYTLVNKPKSSYSVGLPDHVYRHMMVAAGAKSYKEVIARR